ncbi:MAG: hypothetical protein L3J20_03570 [Flavobacteriaceae bacterium]|nr:hypothetical protein [Flavobacteriaceae bacterium]
MKKLKSLEHFSNENLGTILSKNLTSQINGGCSRDPMSIDMEFIASGEGLRMIVWDDCGNMLRDVQ